MSDYLPTDVDVVLLRIFLLHIRNLRFLKNDFGDVPEELRL